MPRDANGFAQDGVQQLAEAILGFDGGYGDHQLLQRLCNKYKVYKLYGIAGFFEIELESDAKYPPNYPQLPLSGLILQSAATTLTLPNALFFDKIVCIK